MDVSSAINSVASEIAATSGEPQFPCEDCGGPTRIEYIRLSRGSRPIGLICCPKCEAEGR